jgi:hypothetical protein
LRLDVVLPLDGHAKDFSHSSSHGNGSKQQFDLDSFSVCFLDFLSMALIFSHALLSLSCVGAQFWQSWTITGDRLRIGKAIVEG